MHNGTPKKRSDRAKRAALLIAVNLGIFVLLLLLLEIILHFARIPYSEDFIPSENALAHFDEELGWDYIPGLSKDVVFGSRVVPVHFDENGIRVPEQGHRLSPDRPSVLFIGGSYTMGHGLTYDESFVGQFDELTGHAYQAVNLGVQAYGTDQALIALKKFAPLFNTKVVVYTFIEDHIYRNGTYDRRYQYPNARIIGTKPLFALDRDNKLYIEKQPRLYKDLPHSHVYDLLKLKLTTLLGIPPPYPEELTKALIQEMADYCKTRHIQFILLNWRWTDEDYDNFGDMTVQKIDTLENAPAGWADMRIPQDGHPNAEASRHAALLLFNTLQKMSLLKKNS